MAAAVIADRENDAAGTTEPTPISGDPRANSGTTSGKGQHP
ncbi:hypothetical protein SMF913_25504 [Streptomyces malaysiensis]|uniref:Uncharacterized protein n=1 Tax=Streptomyces malaysiensis TaxID=92644 RepID=A0A2J7YQ33_STRMQ|nr:hypothetical protein SMF913_25504 [Streptomyces malaysiensis]